jgi:hypothetical protein
MAAKTIHGLSSRMDEALLRWLRAHAGIQRRLASVEIPAARDAEWKAFQALK